MGSNISEALTCRIDEALADCRASTEKTCEEAGDTGKLLLSIITPTISAIASAITASVTEVMEKAIKELQARDEENMKRSNSSLLPIVRGLTIENDRLAQYTRKENIRIFGIPGDTNHDAEKKTLEVLNKTGTKVTPDDIAACHRVGKTKNGSRPVIVRFVS